MKTVREFEALEVSAQLDDILKLAAATRLTARRITDRERWAKAMKLKPEMDRIAKRLRAIGTGVALGAFTKEDGLPDLYRRLLTMKGKLDGLAR